ncbi:MAG: PadR family transcriptional regulator [Acidimicrobiales bacterium]
MSRVFGRGELKQALLHAAADLGTANGYSIMHALADRIGGRWQPSPGAIYPALLALEDDGLLRGEDADGARRYSVTAAGRLALVERPDVIDRVADRVQAAPSRRTLGDLLDRLAADAPRRTLVVDEDQTHRIEAAFAPVVEEINRMTAKEAH